MRVENWCGYEIRFVEVDGEWWAILKDICDALGLDVFGTVGVLLEESIRITPDVGTIVNYAGVMEIIFGIKKNTTEEFRRQAYDDTRRIFDGLN